MLRRSQADVKKTILTPTLMRSSCPRNNTLTSIQIALTMTLAFPYTSIWIWNIHFKELLHSSLLLWVRGSLPLLFTSIQAFCAGLSSPIWAGSKTVLFSCSGSSYWVCTTNTRKVGDGSEASWTLCSGEVRTQMEGRDHPSPTPIMNIQRDYQLCGSALLFPNIAATGIPLHEDCLSSRWICSVGRTGSPGLNIHLWRLPIQQERIYPSPCFGHPQAGVQNQFCKMNWSVHLQWCHQNKSNSCYLIQRELCPLLPPGLWITFVSSKTSYEVWLRTSIFHWRKYRTISISFLTPFMPWCGPWLLYQTTMPFFSQLELFGTLWALVHLPPRGQKRGSMY